MFALPDYLPYYTVKYGKYTVGQSAMGNTPVRVFTATAVTGLTGKTTKRARRKCRHCGDLFTPQRATAKYCSTSCRVSAFRTRHKGRRRAQPIPVIVASSCAHCGATFTTRAGRGQVYCSGTCKTLAYRLRRSAAVEALAAYRGLSSDVAADVVEQAGMRKVTAALQALGMVYDQQSRAWLVPIGQGVKVTA